MKAFSGEPQCSLITAADARSTRRAGNGKKALRNSDTELGQAAARSVQIVSYFTCKNI
jgi:hypothetical protein